MSFLVPSKLRIIPRFWVLFLFGGVDGVDFGKSTELAAATGETTPSKCACKKSKGRDSRLSQWSSATEKVFRSLDYQNSSQKAKAQDRIICTEPIQRDIFQIFSKVSRSVICWLFNRGLSWPQCWMHIASHKLYLAHIRTKWNGVSGSLQWVLYNYLI